MSTTNPYAALYAQKLGTPAAAPPTAPTAAEPSTMQKVGTGAMDLGKGILKGAGSTANNIGHLLYPDFLAKHLTGAPSSEQQESYFKPANTPQAVGKGVEQAAEFMVPGGAEEAGAEKLATLAPKLGKVAKPLASVATSALGAGVVNKAQGGDFSTGAAMGAGGQVLGQGLKAAAPLIAETALGIPKAARAFGKTPGAAIINETRGIRPETIASSAEERLGQLNPQLNAAAARSQIPASLLPARGIASAEIGKAQAQNAPRLYNQIQNMDSHLTSRFDTGAPIQPNVTPSELLDLKRGFGAEHVHNWNPEISDRAKGVGRQMYHALDSELDRTVPESAGLNQRISSLIPVSQRAESVSRGASVPQRVLGRFGAHTGALMGGTAGMLEGRREGGTPGAIVGGLTGVLAPELIASPEAQMIAARSLNKVGGLRPLVGASAQLDRKKAK
jgi:hypothetical protein